MKATVGEFPRWSHYYPGFLLFVYWGGSREVKESIITRNWKPSLFSPLPFLNSEEDLRLFPNHSPHHGEIYSGKKKKKVFFLKGWGNEKLAFLSLPILKSLFHTFLKVSPLLPFCSFNVRLSGSTTLCRMKVNFQTKRKCWFSLYFDKNMRFLSLLFYQSTMINWTHTVYLELCWNSPSCPEAEHIDFQTHL